MTVDIQQYHEMIDKHVGSAVDAVVDGIIAKLVHDATNTGTMQDKRSDVLMQVKSYLADKWIHERHQKFLQDRFAIVRERVNKVLEHPTIHQMGFQLSEEADSAASVFAEYGYKTKRYMGEEATEWVKFWKGPVEPTDDDMEY